MTDPFEERASLCALNRIFGYEPGIALELIRTFGSASALFREPSENITESLRGWSRTRLASRISESAFESAAMEIEKLGSDGCKFIGIGEKGYPTLLAECADPPLGLYFRGLSEPEDVFLGKPSIAVVGTRALTYYGKDWCRRIVGSMSKSSAKPLIVSGLAIGVDVTAHQAALESGLPTVAVMATGIDSVYPSTHRAIGRKISETEHCALISDYPPGTEAVKVNFIRRNRIIAGICQATILVESRIKGGGMMTARLANSYERDVFALPGRLDDPASQGCNLLISENLAESIGDIGLLLSKLGLGKPDVSIKENFKSGIEEKYKGSMPEPEFEDLVRLAIRIKARRGISIDELCSLLNWPFSKVSRLTNLLECDGFISIDLLQHCSARLVENMLTGEKNEYL